MERINIYTNDEINVLINKPMQINYYSNKEYTVEEVIKIVGTEILIFNLIGEHIDDDIKMELNKSSNFIFIPNIIFKGYWPCVNSVTDSIESWEHMKKLWDCGIPIPIPNIAVKEVENSLRLIEEYESISYIQGLANYIRENYYKKRLFYTPTKPSSEIYKFIFQKIIDIYVGMEMDIQIEMEIEVKPKLILPIYEEVASELKLQFEINGYSSYYSNIKTYEDFYIQQMNDLFYWGKKCKLKFLHIPKTAGESIEKAAYNNGIRWGKLDTDLDTYYSVNLKYNEHVPLRYMNEFSKNYLLSNYDFFSVVRNPYHRLISNINFIIERYNDLGNTKDEIIKNYMKKICNYQDEVSYSPQYDFIFDKNGHQNVKHIIKYENLDIELSSLFQKYDLNFTIGRENVTKYKFITLDDFSRYQIDTINKIYDVDFSTFSYSKI